VKIYVAAVESLMKKKERQETIDGFLSFKCIFCRFFFFWNLTLFMTTLRVLVLSFPDFADISIIKPYILSLKKKKFAKNSRKFFFLGGGILPHLHIVFFGSFEAAFSQFFLKYSLDSFLQPFCQLMLNLFLGCDC